jgi:hypothetical protein
MVRIFSQSIVPLRTKKQSGLNSTTQTPPNAHNRNTSANYDTTSKNTQAYISIPHQDNPLPKTEKRPHWNPMQQDDRKKTTVYFEAPG